MPDRNKATRPIPVLPSISLAQVRRGSRGNKRLKEIKNEIARRLRGEEYKRLL